MKLVVETENLYPDARRFENSSVAKYSSNETPAIILAAFLKQLL